MKDIKVLPVYQEIRCNMIFELKMDSNFTRKYHFFASGHTNYPPASITYLSVVSRDSGYVAFMISALNDLNVFDTNIVMRI